MTDKRPLTLQSRLGPRVTRDICGESVEAADEVQVRHVVSERLGTAKTKWANHIKLTGDTVVVVPFHVPPFAPLPVLWLPLAVQRHKHEANLHLETVVGRECLFASIWPCDKSGTRPLWKPDLTQDSWDWLHFPQPPRGKTNHAM